MKYELYSVFDKVAGNFTDIRIYTKEEIAKRQFKIDFAQSPVKGDLSLYRLGTYELETGVIESKVEFICNYEVEQ